MQSKLLLIATGAAQSSMQAFFFKGNALIKLPRFELDTQGPQPNTRMLVKKEQISICRIYDKVYCIHHQISKGILHLYQMNRDSVSRTQVINLQIEGSAAIHVVDNLLLCHSFQKKITMLFDIREENPFVGASALQSADNESGLCMWWQHDVGYGQALTTGNLDDGDWEFFQPNFMMNCQKGLLSDVKINLVNIVESFPTSQASVDFLLRRSNSKPLITQRMTTNIQERASLSVLSRIFKKINAVLHAHPEDEVYDVQPDPKLPNFQFLSNVLLSPHPQNARDSIRNLKRDSIVVITQSDMNRDVFLPLDAEDMDQKYFVAVVIEYIRSLNHYQIEPLYFLYELIINSLVRNGHFYQLHQFLQYHVIGDSAPVAYQLLSIEQRYPPAGQLALDMLKRLDIKPSHMVEILLLRKQVLAALRISKRFRKEYTPPDEVTQFLEAASNSQDDILLYTVYNYFQNRKEVDYTKHNTFVRKYEKIFSEQAN